MFFKRSDVIDAEGDEIKKRIVKYARNFFLVLLLIVAWVVVSQCWFTVSEQESAVITTAGKVTSVRGAGLHFKIPLIQSVRRVDMTTRGMTLGYLDDGTGLSNAGREAVYNTENSLMNQGTAYDTGDNLMISNDFNIVSIDFYAEWRVTDPVKVLFNVEDPVVLLSNIIQSSARDVVSAYDVDSVLTDGKSEIQTQIRELVGRVLDTYDIGLMVTNIIIQDAEPPTDEVIAAFKAVEDAKQRKDTMLNEANKYYNENIPGARAESDRITKSAEAVKEARINEAEGQTSRFNEMFAEYRNNPEITKTRMYLETMEDILPNLRVFIDGTGGEGSAKSDILKILDIGSGVE